MEWGDKLEGTKSLRLGCVEKAKVDQLGGRLLYTPPISKFGPIIAPKIEFGSCPFSLYSPNAPLPSYRASRSLLSAPSYEGFALLSKWEVPLPRHSLPPSSASRSSEQLPLTGFPILFVVDPPQWNWMLLRQGFRSILFTVLAPALREKAGAQ